jgi:chromate reductase
MKTITERMPAVRVVGLVGSLRRESINRRLLEAARDLAPADLDVEIVELHDVPLYNGDLDTDGDRPAAVERLKRVIADSDAVLIATPEFNHSVPGVLQNAIDWVSRPAGRSPLVGKPVAVMGASPGALGAARAQQQLKLVLMSTLAEVMPHAGVAVGMAREKFDAAGALAHEPTRAFLAAFMADFGRWVARVAPAVPNAKPAAAA